MLQASRNEDRAYSELVDTMRQRCAAPVDDVRQLWRRLLFNVLITNTDDHLHNLGFLYDGAGHWHLAPAFDLNPMPGRLRESKTWLSEDTGPIDSVALLVERCAYFDLRRDEALQTVSEVLGAVARWKVVGRSPDIGLTDAGLDDLTDAFEHEQTRAAAALLHQS